MLTDDIRPKKPAENVSSCVHPWATAPRANEVAARPLFKPAIGGRERLVFRPSGLAVLAFGRPGRPRRKSLREEGRRPFHREARQDVITRPLSELTRSRLIVEHAAHGCRGSGDVRIGPFRAGGIGIAALWNRHELVRDQMTVAFVHEVDVARVIGRDHGLSVRHRLRHRQSEALAAMERHVAVAPRHQGVLQLRSEVLLEYVDVCPLCRREPKSFERLEPVLAVDALQNEDRAFPVGEGARERIDDSERVLSLENAEEIEAEKEHEAVRQPELFPRDWLGTGHLER